MTAPQTVIEGALTMKANTLLLLVLFQVASCASNRPEATSSTNTPTIVPSVGAQGLTVPLRLSLEALESEGVTELTAVVSFDGRLPKGPTLNLHLSAGAELLEGVFEETLGTQAVGTTLERRFRIKGRQGAVRVTAAVTTAAFGAHAEATWPSKPPEASPMPTMQRVAPVKIHGVTIDKVVPLSPAPTAVKQK